MNEDFQSIDVAKLMKEIRKKWWLILLSVALLSGAAYLFTKSMITPIYRASSTIFIGKESGSLSDLSITDITLGQKLVSDYRELIMSNLVLEEVIKGLPSEHRNIDIRGNLSVQVIMDSRFMRVAFDDANPERAMIVVNKLSEVLIFKAEEVVGVKNVQIVDYAQLPYHPIKPNVINNVAVAGFLGFILAVLIILLKMTLDDTLQKKEDVEIELGLPVLGVIPKFEGDDYK